MRHVCARYMTYLLRQQEQKLILRSLPIQSRRNVAYSTRLVTGPAATAREPLALSFPAEWQSTHVLADDMANSVRKAGDDRRHHQIHVSELLQGQQEVPGPDGGEARASGCGAKV